MDTWMDVLTFVYLLGISFAKNYPTVGHKYPTVVYEKRE